jgi:hypothetical protein
MLDTKSIAKSHNLELSTVNSVLSPDKASHKFAFYSVNEKGDTKEEYVFISGQFYIDFEDNAPLCFIFDVYDNKSKKIEFEKGCGFTALFKLNRDLSLETPKVSDKPLKLKGKNRDNWQPIFVSEVIKHFITDILPDKNFNTVGGLQDYRLLLLSYAWLNENLAISDNGQNIYSHPLSDSDKLSVFCDVVNGVKAKLGDQKSKVFDYTLIPKLEQNLRKQLESSQTKTNTGKTNK